MNNKKTGPIFSLVPRDRRSLRAVAPWERAPPGQPSAIGLDTAPRPLRLMIWACLDRPRSLLPAEPRVRPLVGHFRLAPKGT